MLWTAGVAAPPLADQLAKQTGAEQDRAGRIEVQPDLTLPGHPEISVVGDMMSLRAPARRRRGRDADRVLRRPRRIEHQVEQRAGTQKPFRYRDLGSAAYISRGRAVVSVGRIHASGFIGWLGWLGIHLTFLTTFRNRLGALLTWADRVQSGVAPRACVHHGADRPRPGHVPARSRKPSDPARERTAAMMLSAVLADAPAQLLPAREQMAFTLMVHVILVPFGVALPFITLVMNYLGLRRGDAGRDAAGQALVQRDGDPVRRRCGHRHRDQPRVRPAVAGPDGQVGRRDGTRLRRSRAWPSSSRPS